MVCIRNYAESDAPAVARLRRRVFAHTAHADDDSLADYLNEVFLRNPWYSDDLAPLVAETEGGELVGFHGLISRTMRLGDKNIRVAVGTQFMVNPDHRGMAGILLLRAFFNGPQDLSVTDISTPVVAKLWQRMGGKSMRLQRLHWTRPIRPVRYAASVAGASGLRRFATRAAGPLLSLVDSLIVSAGSQYSINRPPTRLKNLEAELMAEKFSGLVPADILRPVYDKNGLSWLFSQISRKENNKKTYKLAVVAAETDDLIGWFVFVATGRVAEVVQIAAGPGHMRAVTNQLLSFASDLNCRAVSGRCDSHVFEELESPPAFFEQSDRYFLTHTKNPDIAAAIDSQRFFFTRLEGEWWMTF